MGQGQAIFHRSDVIGQAVGNPFLIEIGSQIKDVGPGLLDIRMLPLVALIHQDMHLTAVREITGHFLADKGIRQMADF
jgi:hypothetical protein